MKFLDVGFGNLVSAERIIAVASPDTAPIKRLVQDAKEEGRAIDVSCGQRTRSVIISDSDLLLLSSLPPEELSVRLSALTEDE